MLLCFRLEDKSKMVSEASLNQTILSYFFIEIVLSVLNTRIYACTCKSSHKRRNRILKLTSQSRPQISCPKLLTSGVQSIVGLSNLHSLMLKEKIKKIFCWTFNTTKLFCSQQHKSLITFKALWQVLWRGLMLNSATTISALS